MNWDEIHAELGAANKAESLKSEARAELRIKQQIKAGLRDGAGEWVNINAPSSENDQNDEEDENEV